MSITSAIVLYAVIWFMTLLVAIPIRLKTQGDMGEVVPGTHAGAPEHHNLRFKAKVTTAVSAVIWVFLFWMISYGPISVSDFDWTSRLPPVARQ
ncbi:Predicted secreted protein [Salinihabitans flavidus]|uniref:Predicted secreted protein n=1 Tax=Salinihabitans flavidus TaxID=569882 RepID=A0A1H8QR36_9RHOB|nr:DUF1467 family protein [Salinihabitans flavidus]SEO56652.1 Predicted secreted protein [Salinihabitans flavidus]